MARGTLKCVMGAGVLFSASLLALSATMTGAAAQSPSVAPAGPTAPSSLAPPTTPVAPGAAATTPGSPAIQAPIGHRQPRPVDLPASVQREEELRADHRRLRRVDREARAAGSEIGDSVGATDGAVDADRVAGHRCPESGGAAQQVAA